MRLVDLSQLFSSFRDQLSSCFDSSAKEIVASSVVLVLEIGCGALDGPTIELNEKLVQRNLV